MLTATTIRLPAATTTADVSDAAPAAISDARCLHAAAANGAAVAAALGAAAAVPPAAEQQQGAVSQLLLAPLATVGDGSSVGKGLSKFLHLS